MIAPILRDSSLQSKLDRDGYLKIQLIPPDDIKKLNTLFEAYFNDIQPVFFSSSYLKNFDLKKEISNKIGEIIWPLLDKHFTDFSWFGSAFLFKGSGQKTEMPMHQDWTIVDESKYVALNIWTPLQNTNESNGTLEVVPGSHQFRHVLRAPTLPFYFEQKKEELRKLLEPLPTQAGEAIVLNQALIHYSKPNMSDTKRVAITSGLKSKGAPMTFHYWAKENPQEIEKIHMEDDFLLMFENFHRDIFERPSFGKSLGLHSFSQTLATEDELNVLLGTKKKSLFNRLFR